MTKRKSAPYTHRVLFSCCQNVCTIRIFTLLLPEYNWQKNPLQIPNNGTKKCTMYALSALANTDECILENKKYISTLKLIYKKKFHSHLSYYQNLDTNKHWFRLRYFIDNLQNCVTVFTNFCILDDFSKSYFFRIETNNHLKKLKYNIFFIKYLYKKDKLRGLNYIISNQVW